jgi:hypothetical protein
MGFTLRFIKSEKTVKRNLTIEEIRRFKNFSLPGVPGLSRDVFMLSFYLIGINLIDLCYLTKKDIRSGRLDYKRRKTGFALFIRENFSFTCKTLKEIFHQIPRTILMFS